MKQEMEQAKKQLEAKLIAKKLYSAIGVLICFLIIASLSSGNIGILFFINAFFLYHTAKSAVVIDNDIIELKKKYFE